MPAESLESTTSHLLVGLRDGVATFTLNRPERRNAMSDEMVLELARLLGLAEADDRVGAILLTGAGTAFCSGGDVKGFDEQGGEGSGADRVDPVRVERQRAAQRETVGRLFETNKPTIAALPGAAAGAGLGLALATDLRIGCPRTLAATAFASVGLAGDYGVAWLLNTLVGHARASALMMLGERVPAEELMALGLLHSIVEQDELPDAAHALASSLANGPRHALAGIKANLREAVGSDLTTCMDAEVVRHMETGLTADHREAVSAFVEKRAPRWGQVK